MKHTRRGRPLIAALLALALCVGLLSLTALAAEEDWEHTSHGTDWTELTEKKLEEENYTLQNGNYYFSGTIDEWGELYVLTTNTQLTITGTVTLCLNNTRYTYEGEADAAIVVGEDANLTICCCQGDEWGNYDGMISNSNVFYGIYNNGTLTVTGGGIAINKENGAAVYNAGTCTLSGGSVSGSAMQYPTKKTAYGVYNEEGASLTITGSPNISGSEPGEWESGSEFVSAGPQIDILTYDTIEVQDLPADISDWQSIRYYNIGYYGEAGQAVVRGVSGSSTPSTEAEIVAATWQRFTLTYPENAEFIYTPPQGDNPGTLTYAGHTSLTYGDTNVMDNTYYNVSSDGSGLEDGTVADYDILWSEENRTLTLNNVDISTAIHEFTYADSLFSTALEDGITINLIGQNSITVYSHHRNINRDAYAIANTEGGVIIKGADESASLTINMLPGVNYSARDIAGIKAAGAVENQSTLTISGNKGNLDAWSGSMTGIACASFTNTGAFTAKISDASTACALSTGDFANSGTLDVDFTDVGTGVGVLLAGDGSSFTNSGEMDIDIPAAGRARAGRAACSSGVSARGTQPSQRMRRQPSPG